MPTAIEYFQSAISDKRMIQGSWNRTIDGKQYVCLAAAWGKPGTISSVAQCPTNLFPRWVFELMPTLDDGVAAKDVPWLFKGFANRADVMAAFTPEQWESARTAFLIGVIDIAVDAARPAQPTPAPAYWRQVTEACEAVKAALKTGDMEELGASESAAKRALRAAKSAESAENAAKSAENAAWSAAWSAESAAWSAAWSAAKSAENAAWSAAKSAENAAWSAESAENAARSAENAARSAAWSAANAAWSAESAAYKQIASVLFACIDAQTAGAR